MTRALAFVALAACTPAPRPPLPVTPDLDRTHARIKAHAAYYAGRDSIFNVGVYPVAPPRAWKVASR